MEERSGFGVAEVDVRSAVPRGMAEPERHLAAERAG